MYCVHATVDIAVLGICQGQLIKRDLAKNRQLLFIFVYQSSGAQAETGTSVLQQMLVQLVLEYVQIVGCGHSNDVVQRMPGSVEDLLVKVQTVYTDLILFALPTCAYFARFQDRSRLAVFPRRL